MRHNSAITKKKYTDFVNECFKQKTFNLKEMFKKHKIDGSFITTLTGLKLAINAGLGVYNWIGDRPTPNEIDTIIQMHRDRAKAYRQKREERDTSSRQLSRKMDEEESNRPTPSDYDEQHAIKMLKSLGYEIFKVERIQL